MRSVHAVALSLLLVTVFAPEVGANHSDGTGPSQDLVAGTMLTAPAGAQEHVDAQSGPAGEDAHGHFWLRQGAIDFRGDVTCLRVVGNRAVLGGRVERSAGFPRVGTGFLEFVEDNGEPGGGADRNLTLLTSQPPQSCPQPSQPFFVATDGNIIVHDETP